MYRIYYKRDGRFRPMPYKGMPIELIRSIHTLRYILGYTNTFRIVREDFRMTGKELIDYYMKTGFMPYYTHSDISARFIKSDWNYKLRPQ